MYFRNQTTTGKKFCLARDCLTNMPNPKGMNRQTARGKSFRAISSARL